MELIKLTHIKKSFQDGDNRRNEVLRDINLVINQGEFIAIKGSSGAGKTTLLSILGTLLLPDSGSYLLNGKELTVPTMNQTEIRNKHIGFIFQDHRLMPQYTVLENIILPTLAYSPQTTDEEIKYAQSLLELTGITGIAQQYPHTISGGEASRVAVCRALIMKPLLVLADEPTGQLDTSNAQNIASLLTEVNKSLETTIVMVTHSEQISTTAHRIVTLKEGVLL